MKLHIELEYNDIKKVLTSLGNFVKNPENIKELLEYTIQSIDKFFDKLSEEETSINKSKEEITSTQDIRK